MGVTVENNAAAIAIDHFLQPCGSEERDDFGRLAFNRCLDRRIVQDGDLLRRAQARQRRFQLERLFDRLVHEMLDDLLAPGAEGATSEAAAESLDPAEADAVDLGR